MSPPIESYALVGNTRTAALIGRDGSVDWLCLPRFDAAACFAGLLGRPEHGRWLLAPAEPSTVGRRYVEDTMVLETEFETATGRVVVVDFMPVDGEGDDLVRIVRGVAGRVDMRMELVLRFEYGSIVPWVERDGTRVHAIAGPDAVCLDTPVETRGRDFTTIAEFAVNAGDEVPFALRWHPSYGPRPPPLDPHESLRAAVDWWQTWASHSTYQGPWRREVTRSLLVLKALTYAPTGGVVAAPTTSLPEQLGGERNWDYRYCWARDAAFTLSALLAAGYRDEARAWRDWLVRAAAGMPSQLQAVYGVAGERRLPESVIGWLPGFGGSRPVRIGNGAAEQFQLDVYGEVVDTVYQAHAQGIEANHMAVSIQEVFLEFLERNWERPDEGIWEVRGGRRHFTHSKVMAWVAADRAAKLAAAAGADAARWQALRDTIHADVCARGVDERGVFVQSYGSTELDAAALMIPLVGFLPPGDPRVVATVDAIARELSVDGFVLRYRDAATVDGLPPGEGTFLLCSFWLADALALMGRQDEAEALFQRLLTVANDVGLLAEEYDPRERRQLGNFPQAFSHVAVIDTAVLLATTGGGGLPRHLAPPAEGEKR